MKSNCCYPIQYDPLRAISETICRRVARRALGSTSRLALGRKVSLKISYRHLLAEAATAGRLRPQRNGTCPVPCEGGDERSDGLGVCGVWRESRSGERAYAVVASLPASGTVGAL